MFSDVAKHSHWGHTKAGYVAHFGLAPYFQELKLSKLSDYPTFLHLLTNDDSLNSSVQKGQMDIIIRFWDWETLCCHTHAT